jgi:hypothetical protein
MPASVGLHRLRPEGKQARILRVETGGKAS